MEPFELSGAGFTSCQDTPGTGRAIARRGDGSAANNETLAKTAQAQKLPGRPPEPRRRLKLAQVYLAFERLYSHLGKPAVESKFTLRLQLIFREQRCQPGMDSWRFLEGATFFIQLISSRKTQLCWANSNIDLAPICLLAYTDTSASIVRMWPLNWILRRQKLFDEPARSLYLLQGSSTGDGAAAAIGSFANEPNVTRSGLD